MKRIRSIITCLFIVVVIFNACRGGVYMEDFEDVQWTCSDIKMEFTYTSDNPEMAIGTLIREDETIEIVCLFSLFKNIEIYDKSEYDATTCDDIRIPLIIGSYVIKDDVATVTIIQDNLFNGEYLDEVIYLEKTPLIDSSNTD